MTDENKTLPVSLPISKGLITRVENITAADHDYRVVVEVSQMS